MGLREYSASQRLCHHASSFDANAFYSLLMATIREAGSDELELLEDAFPEVVRELRQRYNAPGEIIEGDRFSHEDKLQWIK